VDPVFGAGLFDVSPVIASQRFYSWDSDWIRIAYRTGWAGIVVFAGPLLFALLWGIWAYLRRPFSPTTSPLLLLGALVIALSLTMRFTGLVYFWWPALSLFPVALIAYAEGVPVVAPARALRAGKPSAVPARPASGL